MTLQHIRNWVAEIEVHAKDGDFERARQLKAQLYLEVLKEFNEVFEDRDFETAEWLTEVLKAEEFI